MNQPKRHLRPSLVLSIFILTQASGCDNEPQLELPSSQARDAERSPPGEDIKPAAHFQKFQVPPHWRKLEKDILATRDAATLKSLTSKGDSWELAVNQPRVTNSLEEAKAFMDTVEKGMLDSEPSQEYKKIWLSSNGDEYTELHIRADGRSFGRIGKPRPPKAYPNEENNFGSSFGQGEPSTVDADRLRSYDYIFQNTSVDDRWLMDSPYFLTQYPNRTIGAFNLTGSPLDVRCSGAKIGPRSILTASHCFMNHKGEINRFSLFNPGQTGTAALNGTYLVAAFRLQNWVGHPELDYGVISGVDTAQFVQLGWMGYYWWDDSAQYANRAIYLTGYPGSAGRCAASPHSSGLCGGYMYMHATPIDSNYTISDLLWHRADFSNGQSGSPIYTFIGTAPAILATVKGGWVLDGPDGFGPRMRSSMWDYICAAIGDAPSAHETHICQ